MILIKVYGFPVAKAGLRHWPRENAGGLENEKLFPRHDTERTRTATAVGPPCFSKGLIPPGQGTGSREGVSRVAYMPIFSMCAIRGVGPWGI